MGELEGGLSAASQRAIFSECKLKVDRLRRCKLVDFKRKKTEYCIYYAVLFLIRVTEGAGSELESNSNSIPYFLDCKAS